MRKAGGTPAVDHEANPQTSACRNRKLCHHTVREHTFFKNISFQFYGNVGASNRVEQVCEIFVARSKKGFFIPMGRSDCHIGILCGECVKRNQTVLPKEEPSPFVAA